MTEYTSYRVLLILLAHWDRLGIGLRDIGGKGGPGTQPRGQEISRQARLRRPSRIETAASLRQALHSPQTGLQNAPRYVMHHRNNYDAYASPRGEPQGDLKLLQPKIENPSQFLLILHIQSVLPPSPPYELVKLSGFQIDNLQRRG